MTMPRLIAFITVLLTTIAGGVPARAADVDLALVLAIDVSSSVNKERHELQIRGYTEAFRNPMVADAIAQTLNGAIAVTLVQWAGDTEQQQVIGWTIIHDAGMARRFVSTIAETTRVLNRSTSLSGAIDFSARLLRTIGHNARRRVIDVSGDGSNNQGRPAAVARDGRRRYHDQRSADPDRRACARRLLLGVRHRRSGRISGRGRKFRVFLRRNPKQADNRDRRDQCSGPTVGDATPPQCRIRLMHWRAAPKASLGA